MIKLAHLADTHIRNLKYHEEYETVFKQIYKTLEEEKPDYIIHCGDIAHTKTQISPEFVEMTARFLENLSKIAPLHIILGNHDGNLKNSSRQDSISPIVNALNNKNIVLHKGSGEKIIQDGLTFNVLSIFDEENWKKPTNQDWINIALYHGAIAGVSTDIGYTMEHSDHDLSIFSGFDYALLGDIHKTNQIVDTEGRVRYPGSTIQQNHGETDDKGFLIWEIEDKNIFNVRHFVVPNPRPFITIKLDEFGKFDESIQIKEGARVRVMSEHNLAVQDIRKATDVIKVKYNPESITFLNKATERIDISETLQRVNVEDLRNLATQEKLITEYLKDFNPTQEVLTKVFELNKKYNTLVEENEEVSRNVRWSLKSLKWDHLFNYGKNNVINFADLNGVVGIFGKNFSGKSSIIDSLLWTMQNSTSKNVRKNLNIINQNQQSCSAEAEIVVNNKQYLIERSAEKYTKKLNGEETAEAKTDVWFSSCEIDQPEDCRNFERGNLNGLDRNETDKNIRKVFGTLEDFLFTSMASQLGSLDFINEGSTRRKEILGKFIDLDIFAKKYKMANTDSTDLKAALKRLEGKDYDKDINEAQAKVAELKDKSQVQSSECELIKEETKKLSEQITDIDVQIGSLPKIEVVDLYEANNALEKIKQEIQSFTETIGKNNKFVEEKQEALDKAAKLLEEINIKEVSGRKEALEKANKALDKLLHDVVDQEKELKKANKEIKILEEVPCGDGYLTTCKFLTNANSTKENIPGTELSINLLKKKKVELEKEIESLNPEEIEKSISVHSVLLEKRRNMESLISGKRLETEKLNNKLILSSANADKLEKNIEDYFKNEQVALKLKDLKSKKSDLLNEKQSLTKKLTDCEANILKMHREIGSLEQKVQTLEESKSELFKLREEYTAIAMFEKAMHSNGISYDIIRKKLPVINEEIAKILANVVNFEVFFEDDGKKLDILIKHPKYDPRPIELGSGAEKSLAAMAIRLALTKISSLPIGDIMILDEPATALDEENMEGFMRILDMLKSHFKTIILISHLPELKDVADVQITIDNIDGYACVKI
jgi:DNA repair exonuclease SbcCD ATPase subunit/DNA repair exonuclease SbcCD nuclease subunit